MKKLNPRSGNWVITQESLSSQGPYPPCQDPCIFQIQWKVFFFILSLNLVPCFSSNLLKWVLVLLIHELVFFIYLCKEIEENNRIGKTRDLFKKIWHWNMYNVIYETSRQSRFDAWYRMLGAGALGWPRGMVWGGRREEGSGWGTHVYLWWIHVDIWQNQYNIVKLKNFF